MDGFVARPAAIRQAAKDFESLCDKADYIQAAAKWMHVPRDSSVLSEIASSVDTIREALLDSYGPTGDYCRMMEGIAETLDDIARDYARTDLDVARQADGVMREIDRPSTATFAAPGIDEEAYAKRFSDGPQGSFDQYDQFLSISKSINYMLDFKWIGSALGMLGVADPLTKLKLELSGDWAKVGDALGALEMVVQTLVDVIWDLDGVIEALDGKWEGNASNAAREHFKKVREVILDSKDGFAASRERMTAESLAYKATIETMNDAFEALVGAMPKPITLSGALTEALEGLFSEALSRVLLKFKAFKMAFDAALGAAQVLVAGFAQLARFKEDTRFPEVPRWSAPDVNGVA